MHALFSVSLMAKTDVLAEDSLSSLGRNWGPSLLRDQHIGGTLGWLLGDYPIAILGFALIWAWVRSDQREARRYDRRADRGDDVGWETLNAQFRELHGRTGE